MLVSGIVGVLLIMMTGYLIIYNIFQISVIQDIQSYGQLKTLGTTRRQIKKLISKQVIRLSCIGIPIGLLIGFFIGRSLVPFLMNGTAYTAAAGIKVSVNPLILLALLFLRGLQSISVFVNLQRSLELFPLLRRSAIRKMTLLPLRAKKQLQKINTRRTDLSNGTGKPGAK